MQPENKNQFGPEGHVNGLPTQPEVQQPVQPTPEAGIRPEDPESKKALIRLNKLLAEGADAGAIAQAEQTLKAAGETEQRELEARARRELAAIHGPAPSAEAPLPYPVQTTAEMTQRAVPVTMTPPPSAAGAGVGATQPQGADLAEQVQQITK